MKKLLTLLVSLLTFLMVSACAHDKRTSIDDYQVRLAVTQNHHFNENQIKSFVYYWFSLHDHHADIQKSYALLDGEHLLMQYPEITVHNFADYQKWYSNVGKNIVSNLHQVKQLKVIFLPQHRYQVDIVVNWQAIDRQGKFINVDATQQWVLVDGASSQHPFIEKYLVIHFQPLKSSL
jgi:hypothetical protein